MYGKKFLFIWLIVLSTKKGYVLLKDVSVFFFQNKELMNSMGSTQLPSRLQTLG